MFYIYIYTHISRHHIYSLFPFFHSSSLPMYVHIYTYTYMYICTFLNTYTHIYIQDWEGPRYEPQPCNPCPLGASTVHDGLASVNNTRIQGCVCGPGYTGPYGPPDAVESLFFFDHSCTPCQHGIDEHCNTLQHTATHCNTLQHTAMHCNTLQLTAAHCSTLQHNATHCNRYL